MASGVCLVQKDVLLMSDLFQVFYIHSMGISLGLIYFGAVANTDTRVSMTKKVDQHLMMAVSFYLNVTNYQKECNASIVTFLYNAVSSVVTNR